MLNVSFDPTYPTAVTEVFILIPLYMNIVLIIQLMPYNDIHVDVLVKGSKINCMSLIVPLHLREL